MKNLIKKHSKVVLLAGVLLFSCEVFSASEATKRMIHDTLSKYCIPPKKENCNPSQEGQYDPNYDFCLCNDDGMIYNKSDRICKDCRAGTYYRRDMKDNKCKDCRPGTYSGSGAASCTNCPAGSFNNSYGNSGCTDCSPGHYASGTGNTSCSSCSPGSYQPYKGKDTCLSCDSNACYEVRNNRTSCEYKCGGSTSHCSSGSCVQCTSDSHCGGNYTCSSNSCVCSLSAKTCEKVVNCTLVDKCTGTYDKCDTTGYRAGDCYKIETKSYPHTVTDCEGDHCKNTEGCYKNSHNNNYHCHSKAYTEEIKVYANE